jgi:hypothetical protein
MVAKSVGKMVVGTVAHLVSQDSKWAGGSDGRTGCPMAAD